ncbi:MAG: FAD-binding oxidoreductase [Solirubrobacterales bacterium]|nr:FAD-binding oxidoreductase [Solirubrobacterales bacterium]
MDGAIDRRKFLARSAGAAGLSLTGGVVLGRVAGAGARGIGPPIRGQVIKRGAPDFLTAAHVYNERFDNVLPSLVARPIDAADVRAAITWAVKNGVPLRARSGGHSYAGYSTLSGGMVLDLRNLRQVTVDTRNGTATIGAGAQLIDVYATLAARGVTIPAGSCPSVGIAGHALGGGMGLAARQFGLTADNLLSAEMVTADGRARTASARREPDLYWALRGGGGGNFGVVTSLSFRVHAVPRTVATFFLTWPWSRAADALDAWQRWAPHARSQLTSIFHLNGGGGATSVNVSGQYFGPASDLGRLLAPLTAVGGARLFAADRGYMQAQLYFAGCSSISLTACHTVGTRTGGTLTRDNFEATSDYVGRALPTAARRALIRAAEARAAIAGHGSILFDSYGGAINRVAGDATAFVHRSVLFCVQYLSYDGGGPWLAAIKRTMAPYVTGGAYLNYTDPGLAHWQTAYYGSNYSRLLAIRRAVDPHHYFNFPQAIGR